MPLDSRRSRYGAMAATSAVIATAAQRRFVRTRARNIGNNTSNARALEIARAATLAEIIAETAIARVSERGATRIDDQAHEASMELRKRDGYF